MLKKTTTIATATPPLSLGEENQLLKPKNVAEITMVHKDTVSEPQLSDLDDIETSSVGSAGAYNRRVSMLYTTPRKGTGVEMDHCTVVANEMLQRGKEALEAAVTMKREPKATVYECLQGLYETVLSLSDSRNRHKCSLEKERARHAKELITKSSIALSRRCCLGCIPPKRILRQL